MTTFVSLATSATMFPAVPFGGTIITSVLTPELVKARLAYPHLIVSALNPSHATTIDAIRRRYGLDLPLPVLAPGQRAPQVKLGPGDELFIVQASLPRLNEGEVHSDETVAKAPISFLRWRVPVQISPLLPVPTGIPRFAFTQIVDHAHSIALWQRGEDHLQDADTLKAKYGHEIKEMQQVAAQFTQAMAQNYSSVANEERFLDTYLECADALYYALCHWHQTHGEPKQGAALYWDALGRFEYEAVVGLDGVIDTMLLKYARRAAGLPKDIEAERRLVAPLFERTATLYAE